MYVLYKYTVTKLNYTGIPLFADNMKELLLYIGCDKNVVEHTLVVLLRLEHICVYMVTLATIY